MIKKLFFIIVCIYLIIEGTAFAHRPRRVVAEFDKKRGKLTVVVRHRVRNTEKHFVKEVVVKLSDDQIASRTFTEQENANFQTAVLDITNLNSGDIVTVEAVCSIAGVAKVTFEIE
jgi:hypothetical protein